MSEAADRAAAPAGARRPRQRRRRGGRPAAAPRRHRGHRDDRRGLGRIAGRLAGRVPVAALPAALVGARRPACASRASTTPGGRARRWPRWWPGWPTRPAPTSCGRWSTRCCAASPPATSPTCCCAPRPSPGWWPPAGPALAEPTARRGAADAGARRAARGGRSPGARPGRLRLTSVRRRRAGNAWPTSALTSSTPGRGSPGSHNKPLRAAMRREALPVRRARPSHWSGVRGWPCRRALHPAAMPPVSRVVSWGRADRGTTGWQGMTRRRWVAPSSSCSASPGAAGCTSDDRPTRPTSHAGQAASGADLRGVRPAGGDRRLPRDGRSYNAKAVTAQVELSSWPSSEAMVADVERGEPVPDLFLVARRDLPRCRRRPQRAAVRPARRARHQLRRPLRPRALEAFSADDDLQCMPYGVSPMVIYYNTDLDRLRRRCAARGLPVPDGDPRSWTFDEFRAAASSLRASQRLGTKGVNVDADAERPGAVHLLRRRQALRRRLSTRPPRPRATPTSRPLTTLSSSCGNPR